MQPAALLISHPLGRLEPASSTRRKILRSLRSLGFFTNTLVIYLGVPLLGWGIDDLRGFFSLNHRLGYALFIVALGLAVGYQAFDTPEGIRGGKGQSSKLVQR